MGERPGTAASQRIRKGIEKAFGWIKTVVAGQEKTRFRGRDRGAWGFFAAAAYNLVRLPS